MEPCGELRGTLRVGALWSESKPCRERRIGSMGAQGLVRCVLCALQRERHCSPRTVSRCRHSCERGLTEPCWRARGKRMIHRHVRAETLER